MPNQLKKDIFKKAPISMEKWVVEDASVINKIGFSAKNLTSNAGLFLLLEHANKHGIFDLIDNNLVFENASTNKIQMNQIKTMLCGNFVGIDKLERLRLLQGDPLINALIHVRICYFHLSRTGKMFSSIQLYENGMPNIMQNGGNCAKFK